MTEITAEVIDAVRGATDDQPVRLLVTCQGPTADVVQRLEAGEVTVVDTIPELTVIVVDARERDLDVLTGLEHVTAIERDGQQRALDS